MKPAEGGRGLALDARIGADAQSFGPDAHDVVLELLIVVEAGDALPQRELGGAAFILERVGLERMLCVGLRSHL